MRRTVARMLPGVCRDVQPPGSTIHSVSTGLRPYASAPPPYTARSSPKLAVYTVSANGSKQQYYPANRSKVAIHAIAHAVPMSGINSTKNSTNSIQ
eukprot:413237-Rhodomonas_salina.1